MFDITTQGITGLTGSETSACSGNDSSGMRTPAIAITTLCGPRRRRRSLRRDRPARRLDARDGARSVATIPLTSQFWIMSTPRAEAAARIAPRDGIVTRRAAAALQGGADDRIADVAGRY